MRIGITFDYKNKGVKDAQKGLLALGKSAIKAGIGIGSATAAIAKLNRFMRESVQAAIADEKAYSVLNKTLIRNGWAAYTGSVKNSIDEMQLATGIAEDQLLPAFTTLFNTLGDVTKAQKVLAVATDVSTGTGRDLNSVVAALSKAAMGSNTALSRLNVGLDKAFLKAADFDTIIRVLGEKHLGAAANAATTTAGRIDRLRISVTEAKEEIGKGLVDAFNQLAGSSSSDITSMQTSIIQLGLTIGNVFRGISTVINTVDAAWQKTQLYKIMSNVATLSNTSVGGLVLESMPLFGPFIKIMKMLGKIGSKTPVYSSNPNLKIGGAYAPKAVDSSLAYQEYLNKLKAEQLKREREIAAQQEKQMRLTKLSAKFNLELAGLAAARARVTDKGLLNRLSVLDVIARDNAGLPVSAKELAAAEKAMTNITVNVQGSVVTERDLVDSISSAIRAGGGGGRIAAVAM